MKIFSSSDPKEEGACSAHVKKVPNLLHGIFQLTREI